MSFNSLNTTMNLTRKRGIEDIFTVSSSTILYDTPGKNIFRIVGNTGLSDNIIDNSGNFIVYSSIPRTLRYLIVGGGGGGGNGSYVDGQNSYGKGGNGGDGGQGKTGSINISTGTTTFVCTIGGGGMNSGSTSISVPGKTGSKSSIQLGLTAFDALGGVGGIGGNTASDSNNAPNSGINSYGRGGRGSNNIGTDTLAIGATGFSVNIGGVNYKFAGGGAGGSKMPLSYSNTVSSNSVATGYGGGISASSNGVTAQTVAESGKMNTGGGGGGGIGSANSTGWGYVSDDAQGGNGGKGVIYLYI